MLESVISPKEKANELADKFGISTAKDVVNEMKIEINRISIITRMDAYTHTEFWDDVISELGKLNY